MAKRESQNVITPSGKNYNELLQSWFNWLDDGSASDVEDIGDNFVPQELDQHTDTETDNSTTDSTENIDYHGSESEDLSLPEYFLGKNKYKWSKHSPIGNDRTPAHNTMAENSTNLHENDKKDALSIWNRLIDHDMLNEVLKWTNMKIFECRSRYLKDIRPELRDIDLTELHAFLGLLTYTAVLKANHDSIDHLFATDGTGRDIFRSVMSKNRFVNIMRCLRFDNPGDRCERKINDKLAAISFIFNKFVSNSQKLYNVGDCATVDEMLLPFRGRSTFVIYMPKISAKYGLKLMCLCDARSSYFYNGYLYTGEGSDGIGLTEEEQKLLAPTQSVLRLAKPLYGSSRNLTFDKRFTSVELIDALKRRNLTCVGVLKKNKPEIPGRFLPSKSRAVGSSLYGFSDQTTLLSHVPKKGKAILIASSMHHGISTDEQTGKPEMLAYYNTTKEGVDDLDKKCSLYSSSRRTHHWSMCLFFRILDISMINAHIVYQEHQPRQIDRGVFLKMLARSLVLEHMQRKVYNERLPQEIRISLKRILGNDRPSSPEPEPSPSPSCCRKICAVCPAKLKRKTQYRCLSCKKHLCLQCAKIICSDCMN